MHIFSISLRRTRAAVFPAVLFTALVVLSVTATVLAHEGRDVGDYKFVVGFINEPAVEGMLNGVSIRITSTDIDDHGHDDGAVTDGETSDEIDLVTHGGDVCRRAGPGRPLRVHVRPRI